LVSPPPPGDFIRDSDFAQGREMVDYPVFITELDV